MKHSDGIKTGLRGLDGRVIKEYDSGDGNEPHPSFDGSIGTRQVFMNGGTQIEATVTFDEDFKLYSADGVWVEIYSGSANGSLSANECGQCWWIPGSTAGISGTHKFSFYTLFEGEVATEYVHFAMPGSDETPYSNASNRWVLGGPLCPSSLVIYVVRGKWEGYHTVPCSKTEPPWQSPYFEPNVPVIIHSQCVRRLKSENGAPFIFEYRNMGVHGLDAAREEAEEMFGNEDFVADPNEEDPDTEEAKEEDAEDGMEGDDTEGIDDDDFGAIDPNAAEDDDSSDWESEYERQESYCNSARKRQGRGFRREPRPLNRYVQRRDLQSERLSTAILDPSSREGNAACGTEEQDDREELPESITIPAKIETATPAPPTRLQQLTTASSRAETTVETPDNTTPIARRPNKRKRPAESVDLTADSDEELQIKQEATNTVPKPANAQATSGPTANEEEDEEDLRDELRQLEIKRKLRKMEKKRQTAEGAA